MWRIGRIGSGLHSKAERQPPSSRSRDRVAMLAAGLTFACTTVAFIASERTRLLMPGPLSSAHGAIKACSGCHAKNGDGKLSWVLGLVSGDPHADSKGCLACHKMPDTAFNPHGASGDVLRQSTERLIKIAAQTSPPLSARAQNAAFPTRDVVATGLSCATCHHEHQGIGFNLARISNEQCRSCHVLKFDSFDGSHPEFEKYPFKRRTPIIYDHAGHFAKHFPEVAKKDPAKRIPATCSTCHNSNDDKRIMGVAPFDKICSGCHLDQITGKDRASGPKGIAFLSLPGLDLQTLRKKNAPIGEWPDASDAELTPFMKVMIARSEQGRGLMKTTGRLDLQDLSRADDDQIKAVTDLVWEIKRMVYALVTGKASDALGNLNIGGGAKFSPAVVADLTASIPRDVILGAQQQWLPHLAEEIAKGPIPNVEQQSSRSAPAADREPSAPASSGEPSDHREPDEASSPGPEAAAGEAARKATLDPPSDCLIRVLGQCVMPSGDAEGENAKTGAAKSKNAGDQDKSSAGDLPPAMRAGLQEIAQASPEAPAAPPPRGKAGAQSDDLLFPTAEELREMKGRARESEPAGSRAPAGSPATSAPEISLGSDVDPESWADYGGWYRQDYAIFYRPSGHKDKFIYSWLFLTGPQAPKGASSPAAAVFDFLTGKDAQGACTKCHSVDDIEGKGRLVNFSPPSAEGKRGHFTNFVHEPHFGIMENKGCLTCHGLEKDRPYLKSYEQGSPRNFASNFGTVKKELCQGCHTSGAARQDCLTCHKYHVNGSITPIISTKIPIQ